MDNFNLNISAILVKKKKKAVSAEAALTASYSKQFVLKMFQRKVWRAVTAATELFFFFYINCSSTEGSKESLM